MQNAIGKAYLQSGGSPAPTLLYAGQNEVAVSSFLNIHQSAMFRYTIKIDWIYARYVHSIHISYRYSICMLNVLEHYNYYFKIKNIIKNQLFQQCAISLKYPT